MKNLEGRACVPGSSQTCSQILLEFLMKRSQRISFCFSASSLAPFVSLASAPAMESKLIHKDCLQGENYLPGA